MVATIFHVWRFPRAVWNLIVSFSVWPDCSRTELVLCVHLETLSNISGNSLLISLSLLQLMKIKVVGVFACLVGLV